MSRPKIKVSRRMPKYTRRHVLAAFWATFGVVEDGYPPWPIRIPVEVKTWDPDRAIKFILEYLAEKDRTHPPLYGSWVGFAEEAIAKVPS